MDIYRLLPSELQTKVKYFAVEHPISRIIKDEIERLRCDEYYTFRDEKRCFVKSMAETTFVMNTFFEIKEKQQHRLWRLR